MKKTIENLVKDALESLGLDMQNFTVEHPTKLAFGDYTTNAGIISKRAEDILKYIDENKPAEIEKVELKSGFINFYLSKAFFKRSLEEIISNKEKFGRNHLFQGQKVMVEYTDPNPFKEFHIGHLMSNTIGESISRFVEWSGAEIKRACYQGDVGMHVAKAVWGFMQTKNWEDAYVVGSKKYEEDENSKKEIQEVNKKIYSREDSKINGIYDEGRKASLEYFDAIYKKLGTHFDYNFFESETAPVGKQIVEENKGKVFEESEGAIVFKAEKYNPKLHTRVFINSEGLPTYEAKELGLAPMKYEKYPYDKSIVITGNEVNDYFKVLLEAMKHIFPNLAEKTIHLSHGMLRLPTGKMSSRTGDVITAEEMLRDIKEAIKKNEKEPTDDIAVAAVKYMILRQATGNDIIFDLEKSVSTEGDSGPYLQYAHARTNSLLEKADKKGSTKGERENIHEVEKLLYRFPEVVERGALEFAPHYLITYLTELTSSFNNFYAHEQVIGDSPESEYRLAIVEAFRSVLKNGLTILGIPAPDRM